MVLEFAKIIFQIAVLPQQVFESILVDLIIENENDNPPKFESDAVSISIPESQPVGSQIEIPELVAFDADGNDSADLTYLISTNKLFDIESLNGRVFLMPKIKLDREETAFIRGNVYFIKIMLMLQ